MAASADTPVVDLLTSMTVDSVVASSLEPQALMVARIVDALDVELERAELEAGED